MDRALPRLMDPVTSANKHAWEQNNDSNDENRNEEALTTSHHLSPGAAVASQLPTPTVCFTDSVTDSRLIAAQTRIHDCGLRTSFLWRENIFHQMERCQVRKAAPAQFFTGFHVMEIRRSVRCCARGLASCSDGFYNRRMHKECRRKGLGCVDNVLVSQHRGGNPRIALLAVGQFVHTCPFASTSCSAIAGTPNAWVEQLRHGS